MALARHAGLALTILLPVTTSALLRISDSGRTARQLQERISASFGRGPATSGLPQQAVDLLRFLFALLPDGHNFRLYQEYPLMS